MRYIISLLLTSTAAMAEVPIVVTDIPPVHSLTAAVMGDLGAPVLLLDRGASVHDFQFRPSQMRDVQGADLVIWMGPTLAPWLEKPLGNRPEGAAILGLLDAPGTHLQEFGAQGHDHDEGDGHDHQGMDPHAWLDPANGKAWLGLIAKALSTQDPENASIYTANAASAAIAIDAAEAEATALLAPVKARPFVAFHDAYGYFTAHFGLSVAGTVSLGDAATPGARHLAELRETLANSPPTCVFPEAQHDPALVVQLAADTGTTLGQPLDPAGSLLEPGPDLYPALIVTLAETIAACVP